MQVDKQPSSDSIAAPVNKHFTFRKENDRKPKDEIAVQSKLLNNYVFHH